MSRTQPQSWGPTTAACPASRPPWPGSTSRTSPTRCPAPSRTRCRPAARPWRSRCAGRRPLERAARALRMPRRIRKEPKVVRCVGSRKSSVGRGAGSGTSCGRRRAGAGRTDRIVSDYSTGGGLWHILGNMASGCWENKLTLFKIPQTGARARAGGARGGGRGGAGDDARRRDAGSGAALRQHGAPRGAPRAAVPGAARRARARLCIDWPRSLGSETRSGGRAAGKGSPRLLAGRDARAASLAPGAAACAGSGCGHSWPVLPAAVSKRGVERTKLHALRRAAGRARRRRAQTEAEEARTA